MTRKTRRDVSRRKFIETTAAASAALALPSTRGPAFVRNADKLRLGLIGCGGRGTGAAKDSLTSSDNVELVALGDLFPDHLTKCRENLARMASEDAGLKAKIKVDDAHAFSGFDAYQKVLASKIDVVLLATPPAFRARHLAAAIEAGKHVFMEKPVAVDPSGVRAVMASADLAAQKGLAIVAGTQRRHDAGYRATMERVHGGAIGDIVGGEVYWNQGGLWMHPRQTEWSDVEWQVRNWLYFTWLSGDHIVEQHIHNIDVANWALGAHPVRAVGVGGRQWRTDPAYGHIYDHFAIDFEYPNGVHVMSMCRQIDGTASRVAERFVGTRGTTDAKSVIEGASPWQLDRQGPRVNPYVQEHADLIASIRAGKPLNEGRQVAESTLTAIMGREAAYTGQAIVWDELLASQMDLVPPDVSFGPMPVAPVAMPGHTPVERTWRGA
jgi:predicted dehydrogenase